VSAVCPFSKERFFADVDISITAVFGGGADIWNVSTQWAYDGKKSQARTDTQAMVRELSSGASYQRFTYESVTTNGTTYSIGAKGGCTSAPAPAFPADACVGSVARWIPTDETRDWKVRPDKFIGYELVDGTNASVWGWTYHASGNPKAPIYSRHRVYLAAAGGRLPAGTPLKEEQTIDELSGYTTSATVLYRTFEDAYGSTGAIFDQPWSGVFKHCTPSPAPQPAAVTVETAVVAGGACTADDQSAINAKPAGSADGSFSKITSDCGHSALSIFSGIDETKFNTCLTGAVKVSTGCSDCYWQAAEYGYKNCKLACLSSWCSSSCLDCASKFAPTVATCAGFTGPQPTAC